MRDAIVRKARESAELIGGFVERAAPDLERAARALAARLAAGGRLYTIGNGGSACDAQHAAVEFQHPIIEKRRPYAAAALCTDFAFLTAIGNDRDFAGVYAAQLELVAGAGDTVLGISTSGTAPNVIRALRYARDLGACTIGFTGRDGGQVAELCQHPFVVPSWSIHRIQEVHTVLLHLLWDQVHVALGAPDVL
ncbi:MAG TPA: SIS domain-containing protein [Kofleriaceae bacterium]|nr:SIS domain-containing protein [Kofleriaceae bacterium]